MSLSMMKYRSMMPINSDWRICWTSLHSNYIGEIEAQALPITGGVRQQINFYHISCM